MSLFRSLPSMCAEFADSNPGFGLTRIKHKLAHICVVAPIGV